MNKTQKKEIRRFAEEIQPVYKLLDWVWYDSGVPSVEEIEDCILRLFADLGDGVGRISTGGLYVERDNDEGMNCVHFGFESNEILSQ